MKHKKYESISGTWQQKEVLYMRTRGFDHPQYRWCVTEKVHGSNFAFYMDLDDLKNMEMVDKREIDKVVGKMCTEIWRPIFLTEAER